MMTPEEWQAWADQPETQKVFRELSKYAAEYAANALEASLEMDSIEATALQAARHQGYIDGIKSLLEGDIVDGDEP